MGKALAAVGGLLVVCMLVLGAVVYLTRDEDSVAVDALLAERLGRELTVAEQSDQVLDLRRITRFEWDRVYIFDIDTPRADISRALGFPFQGDLLYTAESSELLVFTRDGRFARFADYRGRRPFAGLRRPVQVFGAAEARFEVRDGVVRAAS